MQVTRLAAHYVKIPEKETVWKIDIGDWSGVDYFYTRKLVKNMSLTTLTRLSLSPLCSEIHMRLRLSIPGSQLQTAMTQMRMHLGQLIWATS